MKNSAIRAHAKRTVAANWGKMIRMSLLVGFMSSMSMIGFLLAPVVAFIYNSGLSLGYTNALLQMHDGKNVRVTNVFSMLRKGVSGFGLSLWTGLKLFFWMLPGLVAILVLAAIAVAAESSDLMTVFAIISYVIMLVFTIRAAYLYAMAPYFLADRPEMTAFEAFDASKAFMRGRRFQLFKLTIPYGLMALAVLLIVYLLAFGISMLSADVGAFVLIVGMLAYLCVIVYLSLLSTASMASFYKMHVQEKPTEAEPVAESGNE